ncbi:MAG: hypothetical protein JWL84_3878 [Rhodospirillales bacterium]|nr:hypothetical protein [Rhodospirillales bacterium]
MPDASPPKLRARRAGSRDRFAFFFGTDSTTLEQRYAETFGARLAVVDIPHGGDIRRCLASLTESGMVLQQSAMSLMRPQRLVFPYEQAMALAVAVRPHPRTALQLGLGGGAMVRFLSAYYPECELTIVESDPTVIDLARRHFYIDTPVEQTDAITFLAETEQRFDAIMVDIYGGGGFNAPPLAFWDACAAALQPKGCIAINWAEARDKPVYELHAARAAARIGRTFFLAPDGFKDNVVQLCSADPALDAAGLRRSATALARRQRRKSILDRCPILDDFP